jgi:hypothetical protein
VKDASWKTSADYTLAITNPIFVDCDGDGKYNSPRATALALIEKIKPLSIASIEKTLESVDPATGVQLIAEAKTRLPASELEAWKQLVAKLSGRGDFYARFASK